jgi:hypothetical protein
MNKFVTLLSLVLSRAARTIEIGDRMISFTKIYRAIAYPQHVAENRAMFRQR